MEAAAAAEEDDFAHLLNPISSAIQSFSIEPLNIEPLKNATDPAVSAQWLLSHLRDDNIKACLLLSSTLF